MVQSCCDSSSLVGSFGCFGLILVGLFAVCFSGSPLFSVVPNAIVSSRSWSVLVVPIGLGSLLLMLGLGTWLGYGVGALGGVLAILVAVLNGSGSVKSNEYPALPGKGGLEPGTTNLPGLGNLVLCATTGLRCLGDLIISERGLSRNLTEGEVLDDAAVLGGVGALAGRGGVLAVRPDGANAPRRRLGRDRAVPRGEIRKNSKPCVGKLAAPVAFCSSSSLPTIFKLDSPLSWSRGRREYVEGGTDFGRVLG